MRDAPGIATETVATGVLVEASVQSADKVDLNASVGLVSDVDMELLQDANITTSGSMESIALTMIFIFSFVSLREKPANNVLIQLSAA